MVCSMTRLPAKPIKASDSAILISPKDAKLAATPPELDVSLHLYIIGQLSRDI